MELHSQIEQDYLTAFKAHEQARVDVLRLLKAAIKNEEIALRHNPLTDAEMLTLLGREAKRRRESIALYLQGDRQDLANREEAELKIITTYLPAPLSDDDLKSVVTKTIAELQATPNDFGRVMSTVMAAVKGQADGNRVSAAVKEQLQGT